MCVCVCVCVGECLARFTNKKTPYCVRFNPDEDKQNVFLVGCSDKKIYCVGLHILLNIRFIQNFVPPAPSLPPPPPPPHPQFDIETDEIVQEYDRHLGAVNSITFVDENRRFVTTSDDKSLRVWEWYILYRYIT